MMWRRGPHQLIFTKKFEKNLKKILKIRKNILHLQMEKQNITLEEIKSFFEELIKEREKRNPFIQYKKNFFYGWSEKAKEVYNKILKEQTKNDTHNI